MTQSNRGNRLIKRGMIGATIVVICCFTPALVILLSALGLAAVTGYLDCVVRHDRDLLRVNRLRLVDKIQVCNGEPNIRRFLLNRTPIERVLLSRLIWHRQRRRGRAVFAVGLFNLHDRSSRPCASFLCLPSPDLTIQASKDRSIVHLLSTTTVYRSPTFCNVFRRSPGKGRAGHREDTCASRPFRNAHIGLPI